MNKDLREIPDKGFTHGGVFHADDVFSAALLKILNPNITFERGFKVPENFDGIVFDIGLGEFDHHQKDNEVRDNGVPYASFGKLWKAFGDRLVSEESIEQVDKTLIQGLDESDNIGSYNPLSIAISSYNPTWISNDNPNEKFNNAIDFAIDILDNIIEQERSKELAKDIVQDAYKKAEDKNIIVLPRFVPAIQELIPTDACFVIFPSNRGGYGIQVIPQEPGNQAAKIDFPEEWAGKSGLNDISKIDSLTFCHNARFYCAADKLEDAIKVALVAKNEEFEYDSKYDKELTKILDTYNLAFNNDKDKANEEIR